MVHKVQCSVSPIYQTIRLNDRRIKFEIDSGASDTFCCEATWQTLGKPTLQPVSVQYQVAEGSPLPVMGQFQSTASIDGKSPDVTFPVIVTKVPNLNLLGRLAMMKLKLTNLLVQKGFKPEAKPIFKKPRPVPFSILQDLNEAYEAGIKRGV